MTRIDMSEYQERHSVSRLVGAPPGYVGYDEGGQLTETVRRRPYSVLLLTKSKKRHPMFSILFTKFWTMEDWRITKVEWWISRIQLSLWLPIWDRLIPGKFWNNIDETLKEVVERRSFGLLKQTFDRNFWNRIDEIVLFQPLSKSKLVKLNFQLRGFQSNAWKEKHHLTATEDAIKYLTNKGYDPTFEQDHWKKRVLQQEVWIDYLKKFLER